MIALRHDLALSGRAEWVSAIRASVGDQVAAFVATGRLLIEAKDALPHGEFEAMVNADLPFKTRAAEMFMAIASNSVLSKAQHVALLPPSWGTLYELSRLPEKRLLAAIESGEVTPEMERGEAQALLPGAKTTIASPARKAARGDQPLLQALEEAREWKVRWRSVAALAPIFDAITKLLERTKQGVSHE